MLEKTRGNLERNPKLYGNFIRSVFTRFLLEQQMAMEDDAAIGSESVDPDLALLYRDISQFKDADIPRAAALIAAISRQLDAELSRRRQSRGHSGKLDFLGAVHYAADPIRYQDHRPPPVRAGPGGGPPSGGPGAVAQSYPPEEVALYGQHPDHGLPVPDGPLLDAG